MKMVEICLKDYKDIMDKFRGLEHLIRDNNKLIKELKTEVKALKKKSSCAWRN